MVRAMAIFKRLLEKPVLEYYSRLWVRKLATMSDVGDRFLKHDLRSPIVRTIGWHFQHFASASILYNTNLSHFADGPARSAVISLIQIRLHVS